MGCLKKGGMQERYKREELDFESSRGLQPRLQENKHQKPGVCNAMKLCRRSARSGLLLSYHANLTTRRRIA